MPKQQPYNWQRVKAGDIISFLYKSSSVKKINSILVLNPRLPVVRKDGSSTFHLTGIKIKENNKPIIFFTPPIIDIFERIGEIVPINYDDDIFRLNIEKTFLISEIAGLKRNAFKKISTSKKIKNNYRTYDYMLARKNPIFLDHLKLSNKGRYKPEEEKKKKEEDRKKMKEAKERDPITKKKD